MSFFSNIRQVVSEFSLAVQELFLNSKRIFTTPRSLEHDEISAIPTPHLNAKVLPHTDCDNNFPPSIPL
jgi:hypothetical protein